MMFGPSPIDPRWPSRNPLTSCHEILPLRFDPAALIG